MDAKAAMPSYARKQNVTEEDLKDSAEVLTVLEKNL